MLRGGAAEGDTGFVLIHGGVHRASAWGPLLPHLDRPAFAIDLPGRGAPAAALRHITFEDFVASAVADVRATGLRRVTIVGHSLAGSIMPEVAARLAGIVHHMVFVSCAIPPQGQSMERNIPEPVRTYARRKLATGSVRLSPLVARLMFCNGMDKAQTRFVLDQLCAEPPSMMTTPVPLHRWPDDCGRTYVMLTKDHSLPMWNQRRHIRNLGPCEVVTFAGCHDAFVTHPKELGELLNCYGPPPAD